ncbi:hypothetical protein [Halomicrococcus sp. NG-SE-24]|uniref:hypothetical protein n=1 Tax=Halomicrococcus sp. NG-SE-24 TaxID=3436928 RepID=UPI003D9635B9
MAREDMRLVEVMAMSEKARTETVAFLEEEGLKYTVSDDTRDADAAAHISFPVSAHRVESVQTGLTERDIAGEIYTVVDNPETIVSARFDDGVDGAAGARVASYQRVSRSELHSKAADPIPNVVVYTILTAISAIVATAGVLLESRSVMVGSMVIAGLPLPPTPLRRRAVDVATTNRFPGRSVGIKSLTVAWDSTSSALTECSVPAVNRYSRAN